MKLESTLEIVLPLGTKMESSRFQAIY